MRGITIIHHVDAAHWDYFLAEMIDSDGKPGAKILASASGEAGFIFRVVADWMREYAPVDR